jgi:hypothetical protein
MSNQSMSASHQVSISHDPLEEHLSAGTDQQHLARDNWPSGGARTARPSAMLPSIDASDLRPALLAGAIGLFAAWLVSGMKTPRSGHRHRAPGSQGPGARYVVGRKDFSGRHGSPQPARRPAPAFSTGPEGASSREDLSLDAMNP